MAKKVLIYPLTKYGSGIGHLKRSIDLISKLQSQSILIVDRVEEVKDIVPCNIQFDSVENIINEKFDLLIIDQKQTSIDKIKYLSRFGTVVALDEGGEARKFAPLLIDTLPNLQNSSANISGLSKLNPVSSKKSKDSKKTYLISFGGDDHNHLTEKLVFSLKEENLIGDNKVLIILGPRFGNRNFPKDVSVVDSPKDLTNLLLQADIVFTSFGMTCFEALNLNIPTILFNPTSYHQKLSRKSKLAEIGVDIPKVSRLKKLLSRVDLVAEQGQMFLRNNKEIDVVSYIDSLDPNGTYLCPSCSQDQNPVLARFPMKTYFYCKKCLLVYLLNFSPAKQYNKKYFFEEYRTQYGRSYLEDFHNICDISLLRLQIIEKIINKMLKFKELLDVGCAYGPFLQTASERGWVGQGIDISQDAVNYVKETLKLSCQACDYESYPNNSNSLKVITMWYVIEHFKFLKPILSKTASLLQRGGVFAFSTPHNKGISARLSLSSFLSNSPNDHYTIWSPKAARIILAQYGFVVKKVRITGHHPERVPFLGKFQCLRPIIHFFSRLLRLGDTFEIYAVLEGQ